jgi:hypothetical protein
VLDDHPQVGPQAAALRVVGAGRPPEVEEDVLDDVLGGRVVAEHSPRDRDELVVVRRVGDAELLGVPQVPASGVDMAEAHKY